jgi:hypothetical protein
VLTPTSEREGGCALRGVSSEWCESNGHRVVRGNDFAGELVARGFERVERNSGRVYQGIGLQADTSQAREP